MYRQLRGKKMLAPTYQSLLSDLGYQTLPERVEKLYQSWLKTDRTWQMTDEEFIWIISTLQLDADTHQVLFEARSIILNDEKLVAVFSFLQYVFLIGAHPSNWLIQKAPQIIHPQVKVSVFQLMAVLSLTPIAKTDYESRNIDEEHMMFNLNHLKGYIRNYQEKNNDVGIENFGWATYLASLGLIHISSLHFMHHIYSDRFIFFRNYLSGEVVALAENNMSVRCDGQFDGINSFTKKSFTTSYIEDPLFYQGYRVNPMGSVSNELMNLSRSDYKLILKPGDYVIDFHIPTKSDYSIQGFKQSISLAKDFFQSHYPEYPYSAFWCVSWLYSPQITELIGNPKSHIIEIAKEGYRLPATPDAKSIYSFVFGNEKPQFETIVPKTSLEKSIINYVNEGFSINAGSWLYFLDDLDKFGQQVYIQREDELNHRQMIKNI